MNSAPAALAGTGALAPAARRSWHGIGASAPGHLVLADGRTVHLRPVQPGDAAAEEAFVNALSPQSRRRRFHGAVKQLPGSVLQAMTSIDFRHHVALVAEARWCDGAARLVADARYVRSGNDDAEFAIAVGDDWQGLGLGRALLQHLGRHARLSGVRTLRGSVLADNAPMLALMQGVGARLARDPFDATVQAIMVL